MAKIRKQTFSLDPVSYRGYQGSGMPTWSTS